MNNASSYSVKGEALIHVEGKIEGLLAQLLQMPAAGINDDLAMKDVEIWDSLKHMELIVSVEQSFNVELTFEEIIAMQSVREIKRVLDERGVLT